MHSTLTEYARCLYGDEYGPTPECDRDHQEFLFVERLTFADADAILAMLRELCPHVVDGYLPVWIRNLAYRLVLLQRPDEPALLREAAENLWMHGPDWDDIAAGLVERADAPLVLRFGDGVLDLASAQVAAVAAGAVGLVAAEVVRAVAWVPAGQALDPDPFEHGDQLRAVAPLAGRDQ